MQLHKIVILALAAAAADAAEVCKSGHAGCSAGKWQYTTGRTYCYSCYYGRYNDQCNERSTGYANACKACPTGQTTKKTAQVAKTACEAVTKKCPGGQYSYGTHNYCYSCQVGKFTACAAVDGKIPATCVAASSAYGGPGVCKTCPTGTTSGAGSKECVKPPCKPTGTPLGCQAGKYKVGSSNYCYSCAYGRYSKTCDRVDGVTDTSADYCTLCPAGKTTSGTGAFDVKRCDETVVAKCAAGKYQYRASVTTCYSCPYGKWNTAVGTSGNKIWCRYCPAGKTVGYGTGLKESSCKDVTKKCKAGQYTYGTHNYCYSCQVGKYGTECTIMSATLSATLKFDVTSTAKAATLTFTGADAFKGLEDGDKITLGGLTEKADNKAVQVETYVSDATKKTTIIVLTSALKVQASTVAGTVTAMPASCIVAAQAYGGVGLCKACPKGQTSGPMSTSVKNCKTPSCVHKLCKPGKYSNGVSNYCYSCQSGRYQGKCDTVGDDVSACTACPSGRTGGLGATEAADCKLAVSSTCVAGKYKSSSTSNFCAYCPYGKYQDKAGAAQIGTYCLSCPAGKTSPYSSNNKAESACKAITKKCGSGQYTYGSHNYCYNCPYNTYGSKCTTKGGCSNPSALRNGPGAACKKCPSGRVSGFGITSVAACIALPKTCVKGKGCMPGQYQYSASRTFCYNCPYGKHTTDCKAIGSAACKKCPKGQYTTYRGTHCQKCPTGKIAASHTCVDPTTKSKWEPVGALYCRSTVTCYAGGKACTIEEAEAQVMQSDKYVGIYDANCDNHEGGDGAYRLCKKRTDGKHFGPSTRGCVWQKPPSPCDKNPCKNGATCADKSTTDYACKCKGTFYGKSCEIASKCKSTPCKNGSKCTDAFSTFVQPAMFACSTTAATKIAGKCASHVPKSCSKDDKDVKVIKGAGVCWKMNSHKMAANTDASDWIKDSAGKNYVVLCEDECMCLCKSTKGCVAFDYRQTNKVCRMQKRVTDKKNADCSYQQHHYEKLDKCPAVTMNDTEQICVPDCKGDWGAWSACSKTCGTGTKTRIFKVTQKAGKDGGKKCLFDDGEKSAPGVCINALKCPLATDMSITKVARAAVPEAIFTSAAVKAAFTGTLEQTVATMAGLKASQVTVISITKAGGRRRLLADVKAVITMLIIIPAGTSEKEATAAAKDLDQVTKSEDVVQGVVTAVKNNKMFVSAVDSENTRMQAKAADEDDAATTQNVLIIGVAVVAVMALIAAGKAGQSSAKPGVGGMSSSQGDLDLDFEFDDHARPSM